MEFNGKNISHLELGRYRHYKGGEYEIIGIAKHSDTMEELVVYRSLYGESQVWARPLIEFMGEVEVDGKITPRFVFLGK